MTSEKIINLIQEQVAKELYSAYLYYDFANYYKFENLKGFGNYFNVQAKEEFAHAELFMEYLLDNGVAIKLDKIDAPNGTYKDFEEPLKLALQHEKYITKSINDIYAVATEEKDFRTTQFLDWFIKEQGEEEASADELIGRYKLFATDGKGLYMLDSELQSRTFTPPVV